MVRVYKQFVHQLVEVLEFIQAHYAAVGARCEQVLIRADLTRGLGPRTLQEAITILRQQMGVNASIDKSFVDTIVQIMELPFAQNHFDTSVITKLRRILLFPEELRDLQKELKKSELTCYNCEGLLQQGQLTVFSNQGDTVRLYCTGCYAPSSITCSRKTHVLPLSPSLLKALQKASTHDCKESEMKSEDPAPIAPQIAWFDGPPLAARPARGGDHHDPR